MDARYLVVFMLALVRVNATHSSYTRKTSYLDTLKRQFNSDADNDVEDSLILRAIVRKVAVNLQHAFHLTPNDRSMANNSMTIPVVASRSTGSGGCLKRSAGRGVGTVLINRCLDNEEPYGALCYPKCLDGYETVGCCLCRKRGCPSDFRDDGVATCMKPAPYGRGGGFTWKFSDGFNDKGMFRRCEAVNGPGNCEKSGLIVYPKCRSDFWAVGCCICSPRCPGEMRDLGISCTKPTYGRGAGASRLGCADGMEEQAALCYRKCENGFYGVGPVCWQNCPSHLSHGCGVLCTVDRHTCDKITRDIILAAAKVGIQLAAQDFVGAVADVAETTLNVISIGFC